MVDRYQRFTATGPGAAIARRLGLPRPAPLRRYRPGDPPLLGPIQLGPAAAVPPTPTPPADTTSSEVQPPAAPADPGPPSDRASSEDPAADLAPADPGPPPDQVSSEDPAAASGPAEPAETVLPLDSAAPDGAAVPAAAAPTGTAVGNTAPAGAAADEGSAAPVGSGGEVAAAVRAALVDAGAEFTDGNPAPAALVFDATGIADAAGLRSLYEFFQPRVRGLRAGGRIVVVGRVPVLPVPTDGPDAAARYLAQRALTGFVRALGKEVGHGSTVTLLRAGPDACLESSLRFLLSARSAYVSGQVIDVVGGDAAPADWAVPLAGRTAVVTGAAQGIGAAIAETLARDGARVVCLDVPAQGEALSELANRIGGTALQLDITGAAAAATLAAHLAGRYGGVDVVVHNAGVLRDRTLARMSDAEWDAVLGVNLAAQDALTRRLLADGVLGERPRIVCLSSLNGIAGAAGQTNYATSKAGVIGLVEAYAPALAARGGTINAVAPGFIETRMTASMPAMVREVGRRLSSLAQGGRPIDVAETVAWLAQPGSGGVNGATVRVCGQNFLGA